jgi:chromosome segregation protein
VTIEAEILRSDGSVSGGVPSDLGAGIISQERELRQLPMEEAELTQRLDELTREEKILVSKLDQLHVTGDQLESRTRDLKTALIENAAHASSLSIAHETAIRVLHWQREREARDTEELSALDERECRLRERLLEAKERESKSRQDLMGHEERRRSLEAEEADVELEAMSTSLAVQREALRHEQERLAESEAQRQKVMSRAARMTERESATAAALAELGNQVQNLAEQEEEISSQLHTLAEQQLHSEQEADDLRSRVDSLGRTEHDLQQRVREYHARANQASLALVRREEEAHRLQDQILRDLGLEEPAGLDSVNWSKGLPTQASLPSDAWASSVPRLVELPQGLEERIDRLRGQLRQLEHTNPDAPTEHAELKRRHQFLADQASDLESAADSLRQVVAQLELVMEQRFRRTFEEVATQFADNFSFLFGGGEAELILTEPEDAAHTGVDIRVRPPGKREQGLALLSGGERALAAVALVFAVLSVSSTPFCLLDEVDATLDEVNSTRFRHLLERLAEHTQFVVITHNRRTIEAAGTIYGVSMDDSGVSQVMSLRLDEVTAGMTS